jgi:hypothetical protein
MPSKIETILTALYGVLKDALPFATVERGSPVPEELTSDGVVILRDGEPGEPVEETFSPHRFQYEHMAEIEIFARDHHGREAMFDELKIKIGQAIAANRTAGGADWIEAMAPAPTDLPVAGAEPIKAATIPVKLHFWTTDPLA